MQSVQTTEFPAEVARYFWGDDFAKLNVEKHKKYIITTILEKGDEEAIHWLFAIYGRNGVKELLPVLKLSSKSANFWNTYLA